MLRVTPTLEESPAKQSHVAQSRANRHRVPPSLPNSLREVISIILLHLLLSLLPQLAGYLFFDLLPQAAALAVALAWNYPEQAAGVTITTAAVLWLRWLYNWWRRPRQATTGTQSPTQATYQLPAASPSGRGWSW